MASKLIRLVRGVPGHPSHPPLTDVSIGAYTVATLALVLGALGVEDRQMAYAGLIALSGGLLVALPTAVTGLLDWLAMPRGTQARLTATWHLGVMVAATIAFAVAWLLQRPGYLDGTVRTGGWLVAVVAEVLLAAGGYLGGTVVFVYGHRVLGDSARPMAEAVRPALDDDPSRRTGRLPAGGPGGVPIDQPGG
jgi:uncharacterized membrane protein